MTEASAVADPVERSRFRRMRPLGRGGMGDDLAGAAAATAEAVARVFE